MWFQTYSAKSGWVDSMTCTVGISNLNSSKLFNKYHLFLQIIFFLSLPPSSWSSFVFPPPTTHLQLQIKHQNKVSKNLFASTWHSYPLRGPNGDFWGFIKHSWWSKSKEPATRWKEELRRKKKIANICSKCTVYQMSKWFRKNRMVFKLWEMRVSDNMHGQSGGRSR